MAVQYHFLWRLGGEWFGNVMTHVHGEILPLWKSCLPIPLGEDFDPPSTYRRVDFVEEVPPSLVRELLTAA